MPREDSPYIVGDFWLDKRRDGKSPDTWQIARYAPAWNALLEAGCSTGEVSSITGQTLQVVEHYAAKRDNRKMAKKAIGKWNNA